MEEQLFRLSESTDIIPVTARFNQPPIIGNLHLIDLHKMAGTGFANLLGINVLSGVLTNTQNIATMATASVGRRQSSLRILKNIPTRGLHSSIIMKT